MMDVVVTAGAKSNRHHHQQWRRQAWANAAQPAPSANDQKAFTFSH